MKTTPHRRSKMSRARAPQRKISNSLNELMNFIEKINLLYQGNSSLAQAIDDTEDNLLLYKSFSKKDGLNHENTYRTYCQLYASVLSKFIIFAIKQGVSHRNRGDLFQAIIYLYDGYHRKTQNSCASYFDLYVLPAFKIVASGDVELVKVLLSRKLDFAEIVGKKSILKASYDDAFNADYHYFQNWSLLLEAVLCNKNPAVVNLIIEKLPFTVHQTLESLKSLSLQVEKYKNLSSRFSVEKINKAYIQILLGLKKDMGCVFKVSDIDKRLVEMALINQVQKFSTISDLLQFYDQHKNSLCVRQHQHYFAAQLKKFFFQLPAVPYPTIRRHFITALQKKAYQILLEQFDREDVANLMKDLLLKYHEMKGVSSEWREKIQGLVQAADEVELVIRGGRLN